MAPRSHISSKPSKFRLRLFLICDRIILYSMNRVIYMYIGKGTLHPDGKITTKLCSNDAFDEAFFIDVGHHHLTIDNFG